MWRSALAALAMAAVLSAASCRGDADEPPSNETPTATETASGGAENVPTSSSDPAATTADPCEQNRRTLALIREQDTDPKSILRSLDAAAQRLFSAQTLRQRFHMELVYEGADERFVVDGTITARAPGDAYMQVEAYGQSMEMLVLANDVYFREAGAEWQVIRGGALQQYYDLFGGYAESRGPVDLRPLVDNLRGASLGGHEVIDGREAMLWDVESVRECVVKETRAFRQLRSTDGSETDVLKWQFLVDRESLEPRKIVLVFEGRWEDGLRALILELEFLQVGGPVDIPAPPPDPEVLLDPFLPQT